MLNRSASLAMPRKVLKALPGKPISKDTHLVFSIFTCSLSDSVKSLPKFKKNEFMVHTGKAM